MCAICGIVGPGAGHARERVDRANAAMVHRGPDDGGIHATDGACLGARRLAIIDVSAAGHQPMSSTDGSTTIVFNGEIYNFQRLRAELTPEGGWRGHSDTEVLLAGVRTWGFAETVRRAHGQFAIGVWDARTRTLSLARDRAGKKPLYWARTGDGIAFASTINALLELLPSRPKVRVESVDAYLTYQAIPAPMTIYDGIEALPPAHILRFDGERVDVTRYWDVSYAHKTRMSEEEILGEVERIARRAVRDRLVADRSVGIFLSGGVDSSLITALAAQESDSAVEAVAVGFDDPAVDERPFARQVAAHLGVRLHERVLRPDVVRELPSILWHYGQPLADVSIVPSHDLSRVSRDVMVVALNGDGGDELFGGYTRPMVARAAAQYRRLIPGPLRRAADAALHWQMQGPLKKATLLARAGRASAIDTFTYDRAFREFRAAAYTPGLIGTLGAFDPDAMYREVWRRADGVDDVDRALYGDFSTYFPDQLLVKADVSSMAHSLEARSPLLDTEMIEFAATIPTAIRLRGWQTKHLLKRLASRFVPSDVLYRRKRGFVMPAGTWMRGALAAHVRAALDSDSFHGRGWIRPEFTRQILREHLDGSRDWGDQLFTLLVLEVWARVALDGTLAREASLDTILPAPTVRASAPTTTKPLSVVQLGMEWFSEEPGGLNRVYYELQHRLPAIGVHTTGVVAASEVAARESDGRIVGAIRHTAPMRERLLALRAASLAQLHAQPDAVIAAHFALYAAPLLGQIGRHPFVFHFHGPWAQETSAERVHGLMPRLKAGVERMVYRRADACIVLSAAFGRILNESFGVPWERIHVIPGGVDCDRFAISATRAEARARLGWPVDRRIVLAVRRLTHRMGLDQLIGAVDRLRQRVPDALVLIAGRGPVADELQRQVQRAGLESHCRLIGFIADEDLPFAYRAADMTVVPSVALEGYGLIVPESLAAGTPALVTPVGGLPETVDGLSSGLVLASAHSDAIARGLADALDGTTPLPSDEACRAYARRRNDWPVIVEQYRRVYESVRR